MLFRKLLLKHYHQILWVIESRLFIYFIILSDFILVHVEPDYLRALARAAHLFILYSTTKATESASSNNRRTVHSQDVTNALTDLGFDYMLPKLDHWHANYLKQRELAKLIKKKKKDEASEVQLEVEIITEDINVESADLSNELPNNSNE